MAEWPWQQTAVQNVLAAVERGQRRLVLTSPTGMGKCFGIGTPILMFDGSIRTIEQVTIGDLVMGPDSLPRTVLGVTSGIGELYKITPTKGEPYIVNDAHILSLKITGGANLGKIKNGQIVNLTVIDYLTRSQTFKHCAKGYRTGVNFATQQVPLDPYFLGLWLGDGDSVGPGITTADEEIKQYLTDFAKKIGARVSHYKSPSKASHLYIAGTKSREESSARTALRDLGLLRNKHIPHIYKANDENTRLRVLAGLIDSDGHCRFGGHELTFVNRRLAEDVAYLARSLGLAAYILECRKECVNNGVWGTYHRVSISGDAWRIPTLLTHKRAPARNQKKNVLLHGIKADSIGLGKYAGFQVSGDGLFLLGDFTVTHNSRTAGMLIENYLDRQKRVVLYANRKMLISQLSEMMEKAGHVHGIRAADHTPEHHHAFQIASIQTEGSRSIRGSQDLHDADLAIFDEGHLHTTGTAKEIAEQHVEAGAVVLYLSASPLGLGEVADELIVAGTKAEGRTFGAIVPAWHYAPDEPDTAVIGTAIPGEDFTEAQARKIMGAVNDAGKANKKLTKLFGRIGQHYLRLNPERKPTLLFAPGVRESIWIVDQFNAIGVKAAHIDADGVYYGDRDDDGFPVIVPSSEAIRDQLRDESRTGKVKIISNRFIMREGIDYPWVEHLIFATICGTLQPYIQIGGRGLRACPETGKKRCIVQDHGGNFWRHWSLNYDVQWTLDATSHMHTAARLDDLREKRITEPFCCPQCNLILLQRVCPCGFKIDPRTQSRAVITEDGELKLMTGPRVAPRRRFMRDNTVALWKACFFRARNSKSRMTFAQAEGLFCKECHYFPPRDLPLMPLQTIDWYRSVADVPFERLIPSTSQK